MLSGDSLVGRQFMALADDDDGPGDAAPGSPESPGSTSASTGSRSGRGSVGVNNALQFWRTNPARRTLWGQRTPRWQQARRPVRVAPAPRRFAPPPARFAAAPPRYAAAPPPPRSQREYVVWAADDAAAAAIERGGFRIVARSALSLADGEVLRLRAPAGVGRGTALRRLAAAAPQAVIAENSIYQSLRPSGVRRGESGRPIAYAVTCASGAAVAMIDTAVDRMHPAIADASLVSMTVRAPDRSPSSTTHGTAVASMLVGRRDGPAPGLTTGVRLIAVDAFHRSAGGDSTDAFDLARAIDLVSTQEAKLLNMSLTGPDNAVVGAAVGTIQKRGWIVVAAAGNEGPRAKPLYPAAYSGVIAVSAVDAKGQPWRRSAQGGHIAFAAEGVGIALAGRAGAAEPYTGTSFAAPVVTAMLAGKLQRAQISDTEALTSRLAAIAKDSGEPGRDPVFGFGIVQPQDSCR